jgi:DNA helicase-2/ATP-dependent DNA helicase PcrA
VDADRLLDGLDPTQQRAVTSSAELLAILAGAGSGKTRVLTRRIAHRCLTGSADARHVLAITFTRKAAGELDTRLRAFGLRDLPAAGTFHAVAYAQLRTRWASQSVTPPTLLDRKGRVLARVLGGTTRVSVGDLATEIEWAKARLIGPDQYPRAAAQADRRINTDPERLADWYRSYEQEKARRGLVDFDDLLARCTDAIVADPGFAAAQRWRFRHLFVDEYQDLNPLQERLLRAWMGERRDLTVVGDPNQAIYGWNGADPRYLLEFAHQHPGAEVIRLDHAYRSTPQILRVAAAVLGEGDPNRMAPIHLHRPDGAIPEVVGYATDGDEAKGIARAVHDHHAPGRPWSAQAVLVRTNAQAAVIAEAFRRGAIPYMLRGGTTLLDDPEVRDLLKRFERSDVPLVTTLADLEAQLADELERSVHDSEGGADPDASAPTRDERTASGRRQVAYETVLRLGRDLLVVDPTARTDAFAGWLRATLTEEAGTARDAVTIASFHAAKGLEWPVVHVAGLEAGLVPITHARTAEDRGEERRLLYVALTRALDVVRCTWAAQRTFGTRTVDRSPSPYLGWIQATVAGLASHSNVAADPRAALDVSRAALAARGCDDDGWTRQRRLRAALHTWRDQEAAKACVRPTVVLTDRAVEDLVRARPDDASALAEVSDVAPAIRARHGARLLAIIAEHS